MSGDNSQLVVRRERATGVEAATGPLDLVISPSSPPVPASNGKKLFVHIGVHKTGSSSIQQALSESGYRLHQEGVIYPSCCRHPIAHTQHALLAGSLKPGGNLGGIFEMTGPVDFAVMAQMMRYEIDLSGAQSAIVSSEEFHTITPAGVAKFAMQFRDYDIRPIVFIRNFPDLLDSYYGTYIQYSDQTDAPSEALIATDLPERLRWWADIAGDKTIHVHDFDASDAKNSVKDFLKIVGLESMWTANQAVNPSLPAPLITIIRELRKQPAIEAKHIDGLLRQLGSIKFSERQTHLGPNVRASLMAKYEEQIAELRSASWVKGLDVVPTPHAEKKEPVYVGDLTNVLFALGRALAKA